MMNSNDREEEPLIHVLEIAGNAIIGGMEKYVYHLARHLPARDFAVSCMAPYESAFTASLRNLGCEVYITPMSDDPPWRSIQFVTELIRHKQIDILHAHLPRAHVLAGISGRLAGIPVVATVHGMDITAQELGITLATGSHLTVVCQEAYSQALALGLSPERLTLIPNGVDLDLFNPNRTGKAFRHTLGIPSSAPLVGFVGRLAWEKGPDMFVHLAHHVHEQMPEVHFAMVGDGPMLGDLKELVQHLGLASVFHLPGSWSNMWEVYPAFDVLVQTSRIEGMPFALLEAMASGVPVVAMSVGGVAEIIEVGSVGLVSAPTDWSGLGDAVLKLLNNPVSKRQMGVAARKRVEELFNLQDSIFQMSNLFRRLTDHKLVTKALLNGNGIQPKWRVHEEKQEIVPADPKRSVSKPQP